MSSSAHLPFVTPFAMTRAMTAQWQQGLEQPSSHNALGLPLASCQELLDYSCPLTYSCIHLPACFMVGSVEAHEVSSSSHTHPPLSCARVRSEHTTRSSFIHTYHTFCGRRLTRPSPRPRVMRLRRSLWCAWATRLPPRWTRACWTPRCSSRRWRRRQR
jgi:hypothetical protein